MSYQVMPPLTEVERADLEQSIKANGVVVPVLIDDGGEIIDGHHRAEIADRLGIEYVQITKDGTPTELRTLAYSLNLHRRHLTREQKREIVETSLKADPQLSDREHGRRTGVDHKTAAAARDALESTGELPQSETRTSGDGRERPSTQPPREPVDLSEIADTPELTLPPHLTESSAVTNYLANDQRAEDLSYVRHFLKEFTSAVRVPTWDAQREEKPCQQPLEAGYAMDFTSIIIATQAAS